MSVGARQCGFSISAELVHERGQKRRARQVKADRKVTHYNSGMHKSISEYTMRQTTKWIGYSSRRPISLINT